SMSRARMIEQSLAFVLCFTLLILSTPVKRFLLFFSRALRTDQHSFPTRRSSDLRPFADTSAATPASPGSPSLTDGPSSSPRATRSEEHTSELQSRFDLVCRLLLEKKQVICNYNSC